MMRNLCRLAICATLLSATLPAAEVPRRSPDLAVTLGDGKQFALSAQRGKVVALLFVVTYCAHCHETVRLLSGLQKEFGPRGLQVVATAVESTAKMALPDFIRHLDPAFPVGYNDREEAAAFLEHPPTFRLLMPQLVFIDREGAIRAQYGGDDPSFFGANEERNMRAKVEELLKQEVKNKK